MVKEQAVLIIGTDHSTDEKDNSAVVLNLYYKGKNHIIYQTEDKEQIEAFDEIARTERKKQQSLLYLDEIENAKPSEALNKLDYIKRDIKFAYNADYINFDYTDDIKYIEQTLLKSQEQHLKDKAFELIILKNVDVNEIRPNATAEAYNSKIPYYRQPLTDDEFKFLKEMVHILDCTQVVFELPKWLEVK